MIVYNPVERFGISVVTPTSTTFRSQAAQFFPPGDLDNLDGLVPSFVIVKNNTDQYLAGITVLFTYLDLKNGLGTPLTSRKSAYNILRNHDWMLPPGASILASPAPNISATMLADGQRRIWPILTDETKREVRRYLDFYAKHPVTASVDSIILEDGSLVGPDSGGFLKDVNARLQAERDLRSEVILLHSEALRPHLTKLSRTYKTEIGDEYTKWKQIAAQTALVDLDRLGEAEFLRSMESARLSQQFQQITRRTR